MRPTDAQQGVGDSLQADVMRFMAIIAFCLIAILALVRSVEPVPPDAARTPPDVAVQEPVPAARPVPAVKAAEAEASVPEPASTEPPPTELAQTEPSQTEPARTEPATGEPASTQPAPADAAPAAPGPESQEGLRLRFASEQDFLRLVNQGDVRLFAFREGGEVLSVSADFRFRPAAEPPGRVHELLPQTIPDLMAQALRTDGATPYRWGIAMPERMARQIRGFVDRGVTGELVINRYGEVRHHDA